MKKVLFLGLGLIGGCASLPPSSEPPAIVLTGDERLWLRPSEQDRYTCVEEFILSCDGTGPLSPALCRCKIR